MLSNDEKYSYGGDPSKRIKASPGEFQCGCLWVRSPEYGDVLTECPIHRAATIASVIKASEQMIREGAPWAIPRSAYPDINSGQG